MIRTVWTFPGQLTEYVGMGRSELFEGSSVLERNLDLASRILGQDLVRLCREGPEEDLRRDECAAAAVVTVGASAAAELFEADLRPDGVLGYSLGLYTAAVAAGALSLETALRLVIAIAREGERIFGDGEMAMGFITGLRLKTLEGTIGDLLEAGEVAVTNVNSQGQIVVAGRRTALDAALARVRPQAIRSERLPISRPYHSLWMSPVARVVADMCGGITVSAPRIRLFDHRDGTCLETAEAVRTRLSSQLTSRLDWNASILRLVSEGAAFFIEMPPGASTTRMVRWIARDATCLALDEAAGRQRFLAGAGLRGKVAP